MLFVNLQKLEVSIISVPGGKFCLGLPAAGWCLMKMRQLMTAVYSKSSAHVIKWMDHLLKC